MLKNYIIRFFLVEGGRANNKVAIVPGFDEYTALLFVRGTYPDARVDCDNISEFIDMRNMGGRKGNNENG
jgi:hypothetical protein